MHKWLKETKQLLLENLRLLLCGKETWILLTAGLALLLALLLGMDDVKEEKSRIPIGISDEDGSDFSLRVTERVKQLEGYEITEGETGELLMKLSSGELSAVCVIREGYKKNVLLGKTKDLVLLYETGQGPLLFTDVLAGAMMQEICGAKSNRLYEEYLVKKYGMVPETTDLLTNASEFYNRDERFDFSFEVEYRDAGGETLKKPENAVIYLQAIFAIGAMMMGVLTVYALMPYHRMCHGILAERMKTLPMGIGCRPVAAFVSAIMVTGSFSAAFLGMFVWRNGLGFLEFSEFLICTLVYLCVIVGIVLLGAAGIRSRQLYQTGMTAVVLAFSIFGLISIVEGLLLPEGFGNWVPNARYVREMIHIYQN